MVWAFSWISCNACMKLRKIAAASRSKSMIGNNQNLSIIVDMSLPEKTSWWSDFTFKTSNKSPPGIFSITIIGYLLQNFFLHLTLWLRMSTKVYQHNISRFTIAYHLSSPVRRPLAVSLKVPSTWAIPLMCWRDRRFPISLSIQS